jgi:hypothetical protein
MQRKKKLRKLPSRAYQFKEFARHVYQSETPLGAICLARLGASIF